MQYHFDSSTPLFMQVAKVLEDDIFCGRYPEGSQVPSTSEISQSGHLNPATVLKGVNILVERGWVEKRRGLGMFVAQGAVESIRESRKAAFHDDYIRPLKNEADALGLTCDEVVDLVKEEFDAH